MEGRKLKIITLKVRGQFQHSSAKTVRELPLKMFFHLSEANGEFIMSLNMCMKSP